MAGHADGNSPALHGIQAYTAFYYACHAAQLPLPPVNLADPVPETVVWMAITLSCALDRACRGLQLWVV